MTTAVRGELRRRALSLGVRFFVLVLVGCASAPAAPVLENRAHHRHAPRCDHLTGVVRDLATNEMLAGATIVAVGGAGEDVVITDENGAFDLAMTGDHHTMTVYYGDARHTQRLPAATCGPLEIRLRQRSAPTL